MNPPHLTLMLFDDVVEHLVPGIDDLGVVDPRRQPPLREGLAVPAYVAPPSRSGVMLTVAFDEQPVDPHIGPLVPMPDDGLHLNLETLAAQPHSRYRFPARSDRTSQRENSSRRCEDTTPISACKSGIVH